MATPKSTTATVKADPIKVTGNPAAVGEFAAHSDDDGRPERVRVEAKVTSTRGDTSVVQVTGLHEVPLVFSMPAGAKREHLDSLVERVTYLWQREEDRRDLIRDYAVQ